MSAKFKRAKRRYSSHLDLVKSGFITPLTPRNLMVEVRRWVRFGNLHCIAVKHRQISRGAKVAVPIIPARKRRRRVLRIIFATVLLHVPPKQPRGEIVKWKQTTLSLINPRE